MSKKPTQSDEPYVVQYETKKSEFEYARFWDTRSYEDRAERMLIKRLLKKYPKHANYLVDIGGSFGRLLDVYAKRFKNVAIVDYATNEFFLSLKPAKENDVKLDLIAANAYHLPFADDSQAAFMSIRVMHHLTDIDQFFSEIHRTLQPGGTAIVEAANKNSLKRWLKCLVTFNFSPWRADYVDIGASGLQEDGSFQLIRNYHPKYLQASMKATGLEIRSKKSISWFRRTPITKLPDGIVDFLERLMQIPSGIFLFGPSSWYVVQKPGASDSSARTVKETLVNAKTNKALTPAEYKKAQKVNKKAKLVDLRHPRPRR